MRFLIAVIALLALACSTPPETPSTASSEARTYEVRGLVQKLPNGATPAPQEILIRHEAIPDFVDIHGQQVGMDAMTMPFPVTQPALVDGIAVGDKISFQFEVSWESSPPLRMKTIEKLPPETELSF